VKTPLFVASVGFYPKNNPLFRLFALWYFAILMIFWNVVGRTHLGFEQSWSQWFVALAVGCFFQVLLEWIDAKAKGRPLRFSGGIGNFLNFFPPAIIASSACSMLLFPNHHYSPIIFATVLAICSKVMFRAPVGKGATQHIFNPSNLGVVVTLFTLPWVGIAPPYHFTNLVEGSGNWVIPLVVMATGVFLHWKFTGRLPLMLAWLIGFALQAEIRAFLFDMPWWVPLLPMTSAAFVLFSNYMIPDPATTPLSTSSQILFGLGVAAGYGVLFTLHIVHGLFLSLVLVCGIRGIFLHWYYKTPPENPLNPGGNVYVAGA
jgi:hypothetical protein